MSELVRKHDRQVYLAEARHEKPKEIFVRVADRIAAKRGERSEFKMLDVGCATGEFLYYILKRGIVRPPECAGLEVVPELAARAGEMLPGVQMNTGSVLDAHPSLKGQFDLVSMIGVHPIFDEMTTCLGNVISWVRPGGTAIVVGLYNNDPYDVWISYRRADEAAGAPREVGWNNFSKATVDAILKANPRVAQWSYKPFELPFDLPRNATDPVRTWTMTDAEGRRHFTNGLGLLINLEILEIDMNGG